MKPLIINTSMTRPELVSDAVKEFLYANRRRASAVRLMDTDWPQAALLRMMLVDYVSIAVNDGRNPLVLNAIDRGALAYEGRLGEKPDWTRLSCFVETALKSLSMELAGLHVVSQRGSRWHPYTGQTLEGWLLKEKEGEVRRSKPIQDEGRRIRHALLSHLGELLPDITREHCYGV
ncbi:MAG: hypothetical protein GX771_06915 [Halomonadaceae bacterium]|nr:hypothetical protein [Halomonadaceae bacterium]